MQRPHSRYCAILLTNPWILFWAVLVSPALAGDTLLEPEQAFVISARLVSDTQLEVAYRIAPGYYLYRDKLDFRIEPASMRLGEPRLPPGRWHEDEFFGRSEIYRERLTVRIPLHGAEDYDRFRLVAVSQGCADVGVCFLPIEQSVRITRGGLPGLGAPQP
ncbi:MAG: protein-disulfide reductase DsbD N-terminal domain-containing protein [Burkholderiales bacterium]